MTDPAFKNINRSFVVSFKNGNYDPIGNSFDKYDTPLEEIKDFNAFIANTNFYQPVETNKRRLKTLLKCQEIMIIQ